MAVGLINIQEQLKIARIADHDGGGLKVCESHVVRPSTNLIIEGNRRAGSVVALFNPVGLNTQERLDVAGTGRLFRRPIKLRAVNDAAVAINQVDNRGLSRPGSEENSSGHARRGQHGFFQVVPSYSDLFYDFPYSS